MNKHKSQYLKTRLAPTPSGYLHLGNVLSFAITAAIAQKTGAKILLRIDDLDRNRVNKAYVEDIFETLNFLEIPWHEGPRSYQEYEREWSQVHRMEIYQKALDQLKELNHVFACTCSRSQLAGSESYPGICKHTGFDLGNENTSWRLDTSIKRELIIKTWCNGLIKRELPTVIEDFVVRKKDGYPAYQLSSLVDDVYFDVDLIVRGTDLWPSTLAQHYLASTLNYNAFLNATFHHHPLLMEAGTKKLSKSAGSTSVKYLREQGKRPANVYKAILEIIGVSIECEITNWQELVDEIEKVQFNHEIHEEDTKEH